MNKKLGVILIPVLLVVMLILGYYVFIQTPGSNDPNDQSTQSTDESSTELSEDEKKALVFPETESAKEKSAHASVVEKIAIETDELELKDCRSKPVVIESKEGSVIRVSNKSDKEHNIGIRDKNFVIKANMNLDIKVDFGGGGIYGYSCDSERVVGIIWVNS